MNLKGMEKVEYSDHTGIPKLVLVDPEYPDVLSGIPLLDLGALELPADLEVTLRQELWAVGIKEYADALKPKATELVAAALRSALKLSVQQVISVCQVEQKILTEAGYE